MCGSILLDKKVANHAAPITRNQSQRKQPPSAGGNKVDDTNDRDSGTYQMKQTSRRLAVFGHVMRPEFAEELNFRVS